jgi:hypothetical protein
MQAFYLRASRHSTGQSVSFLRAFAWNISAFLPLLLANYMILVSVKLQIPLMYIGVINVFSLCVILQIAMYVSVLARGSKQAWHDLIWDIKIEHYDKNFAGPPLLRRIFLWPFLCLILVQMLVVGGWAALNLTDQKLSPLLKTADEHEFSNRAYWQALRSNAQDFQTLSARLPDYRCASRNVHYHVFVLCPENAALKVILSDYDALIKDYKVQIAGTVYTYTSDSFLGTSSVSRTDVFLADVIARAENSNDPSAMDDWLMAAAYWREVMLAPGPLLAKGRVLIHYGHVLSTLPILLRAQPDWAKRYAREIDFALAAVDFDPPASTEILNHEYQIFNHALMRSQIDYLPFIQPNASRNQFVAAMAVGQDLFSNEFYAPQDIGFAYAPLRRAPWWTLLYNPLGGRLAELHLSSFATSASIINSFHQNNALKKLLRHVVEIYRNRIDPQAIGQYLDSLPLLERTVLNARLIEWDAQNQILFYTMQGLEGFRRTLIF